jgi:CRP-like cAMP-binding protein
MFIREADLFRGVSQRTIAEIGKESIEENYKTGDVLFREGEEAEAFYVLAEGRVDISIGEKEVVDFVVERPGEIFGWAALVEPYLRTGTATCITDVRVVKVAREVMERVMKKHPEDGFIIMRHLTGIIAQRLRTAYQAASSEVDLMTAAHAPSYG